MTPKNIRIERAKNKMYQILRGGPIHSHDLREKMGEHGTFLTHALIHGNDRGYINTINGVVSLRQGDSDVIDPTLKEPE